MAHYSDSDSQEPAASIRDEIREQGPITFARFMEIALYHPVHGYYSCGADRIGREGDFFTVSDVGTYFGACVARQIQEMDRVLERPEPFRMLEFGGGRGLLARDVLDTVEAVDDSLHSRLQYTLVDRSPGMRAQAAGEVRTLSLEEMATEPTGTGVIVAVELFDALPVHRVVRREGELREIRVGLNRSGELESVEMDPSAEVAAYARRYGAAPLEGQEAEVCLGAEEQFGRMAATLGSGFMILVDYGHPAAQLYDASRPRGTVLAYHRHQTNEEYYSRIGRQDLTAHVNWSGLQDIAAEAGWRSLALTTQDRFLVANGILEQFEARDEADWRDPESVKRRMKTMQLIHPEGMGRMFQVLVLYRGDGELPKLDGLTDPYRR